MSIRFAVDTSNATIRLNSVVPRVRAAVKATVAKDTVKLWGIVRLKLSGDVLQVRTGNLRRSIQQQIDETESASSGRIFSDGSVAYARVQEYGGRIDIPEIVPVNAKALAFVYEGRLVFAAKVRAHSVTIPPRSFMRSSLHEFAPEFFSHMEIAARGAAL